MTREEPRLKPSAERLLGMPPEERDAVKGLARRRRLASPAPRSSGAFISEALETSSVPTLTAMLFPPRSCTLLMPTMKKRKMLDAIERERKFIPIPHRHGAAGARRLTSGSRPTCARYTITEFSQMTGWVRKRLSYAKLNVDSADDLVVSDKGKVDEAKLGRDAEGRMEDGQGSRSPTRSPTPPLASMLATEPARHPPHHLHAQLVEHSRGTGRIYTHLEPTRSSMAHTLRWAR